MNIDLVGLEPIKALSYWRYTRLKRCQLSGAFPSSTKGPLIPRAKSGRAQILGDIYHKLMESFHELTKKGAVTGKELRDEVNRIITVAAQSMRSEPATRHLGDPSLWPELADAYRALSDLVDRRGTVRSNSQVEVKTENRLYSRDGLLFGEIDAYFIRPEGIDLVDYKSGSMMEGDSPKEDYANQLYFYAYLIHENHGVYPRSLTLVGKDSATVSIAPSLEKSIELANDMRTVLAHYNDQVSRGAPVERFAVPKIENCLFCDAKLVCSAFWKTASSMEFPPWAHVAIGTQAGHIVRSRVGGSSIEIATERSSLRSKRIKIARIFEGRFPDLKDNPGQILAFTNLKQLIVGGQDLVEVTERSQIFLLGSDS